MKKQLKRTTKAQASRKIDSNIAQTLRDIHAWDTADNQEKEKQANQQKQQMKALLNSIKDRTTKQRAKKIMQQKEIEENERYVKNVSEMRRLLIRCALQCDAEREKSKMQNIKEQDFETCEELTEEEEEAFSSTSSNIKDMEDVPPEMDDEATNDSAKAQSNSNK